MNKYERTKIYVIENDIDGDFYVGSTTFQYLCERMTKHVWCAKDDTSCQYLLYRKMRQFGLEHFRIRLLEEYPCQTKQEKLLREQFWIDQLQPTLNQRKAIDTRARQEINRKYREENKGHIKELMKKYYEENKHHIKERKKNYYEENRDVINGLSKTYYEEHKDNKSAVTTCECGSQVTAQHLLRHKKSQKHLDYINKL